MANQNSELPLAVDLDGTLILTDMSWVSIRRVLLPRPWRIFRFIWLEITGQRAVWKQRLGKLLRFDPAELEFHPSFMEWVTGETLRESLRKEYHRAAATWFLPLKLHRLFRLRGQARR